MSSPIFSENKKETTDYENWAQSALSAAQNKVPVQIYVSESTLQQMIALLHSLIQIKANPTQKILFFYSEESLQPNSKAFEHYPIHFIKTGKKDLFLGNDAYPIISEFTQAKIPFWLYLPDRAFWKVLQEYQKGFYYLAHAEKVFLFEEGVASYIFFGYKNSNGEDYQSDIFIKQQVDNVQKICNTIRKKYPLSLHQNSYRAYRKEKETLFKALEQDRDLHSFHYLLAHLPKVSSYFQHPEIIASRIHLQLGKINLPALFSSLSNTDKSSFFSYFSLDITLFERLYYKSVSKKNILIIGRHFLYIPNHSRQAINENMYRWLSLIIKKYSDSYEIFYKPHPRFLTRVMRGMLHSNLTKKMHILPSTIPTELLVLTDIWDLYFTNFTSSLFFDNISKKIGHIIILTPPDPLLEVEKQFLIQIGYPEEKLKTVPLLMQEWNNLPT